MIIDTQTHYVPSAVLPLLSDARWGGAKPTGLPPKLDELMLGPDHRLREMDRHGVDVAVLSFAPVGPSPDAMLDADIARVVNDALIAACEQRPDGFVMLARVPLPDAKSAVAELQRVASARCVRGVALLAEATLYKPDTLALDPLWALASDRQLAVVLHPPAGQADLSNALADFGLASGLHAMVGSAAVLARLVYSGVLDRHPNLDVIATHLGGGAPFLAERLDQRGKGAAHSFSHYLRNRLYFDNCGFPAGPALRCAIDAAGAGRIVLGSDWPSRPIAECLAPLAELPVDARSAILGGTAVRWFKP